MTAWISALSQRISCPVHPYPVRSLHFRWCQLVFHRGGQCCHGSGSLRILPGVRCHEGGGTAVGANFGWTPWFSLLCRSRVARRSLARAVAMVVMMFGLRVPTPTLLLHSYIPFVTASMVCPAEEVANIISEFDWWVTRVGAQLRLCGQGLRSRSTWRGAEVDGVDILGPCAQAQGRGGHVHRDMDSIISCTFRQPSSESHLWQSGFSV